MKRLLALTGLFACLPITAATAGPRTIRPDDLQHIVGVAAPTISPDGTRAAVVVSRIEWNTDKYARDLDLIDLATHARRTLTYQREGLSDPSFSPDGTKLAFLANVGTGDDANAQVWVMPLYGGDAKPVTDASEGVDQFAWRPDGGAIAYAAEEKKRKLSGAEKFRDSFVFTTEPITERKEPRPVHLFVVAVSGGTPRRLLATSESVATGEAQSTLSWSPDGSILAFTIAPNAILNEAIHEHVVLVDMATGKFRSLTSHAGYEADPHIAPDGTHIAYSYSDGDNQAHPTEAYVTDLKGGVGTAISHAFDRAVADVAWQPDSSAIYFTCADKTSLALVRAPIDGSPAQVVPLGDVQIASPLAGTIARDGTLVFVGTSPHRPGELYLRTAAGVVSQLTNYNDAIAGLSLGDAQAIDFPTSLGVAGDAVLTKPPGFVAGHKYPLVLFIHGGPTSASTLAFSDFAQLLAARG